MDRMSFKNHDKGHAHQPGVAGVVCSSSEGGAVAGHNCQRVEALISELHVQGLPGDSGGDC